MKNYYQLTAVSLFLLAFWLLLGSSVRESATVDEPFRLFRGVAYVREGATHFLLGHPMTASVLSALPVQTEPNLKLPLDDPAWAAGNWSIAADIFMWRINENPQRILFLGRYPVLMATLLLGAVAFRWATAFAGRRAGLMALALLLFNPNILAYGRIINGDAVQTLFFVATLFFCWQWVTSVRACPERRRSATAEGWQVSEPVLSAGDRPQSKDVRWECLVGTGVCLGLAAAAKFNGVLLVPILFLILGSYALRDKRWSYLLALVPIGFVSLFMVWAVNRFSIRPFLGGPFWEDLIWVLSYNTAARHGAYLAGQSSVTGWWYYFPFAFMVKMPLVHIGLLGTAVFLYLRPLIRKGGQSIDKTPAIFLLLPALLYLIVGTFTALNIGFRYMLPLLPLLAIFTAVMLEQTLQKTAVSWAKWTVAAPLIFLVGLAVWTYPHFIPYFNVLAGGTQNGWKLLSDSNVDWGQDLPALAAWQQETGNHDIFFSYFGTAHPSAYGVTFTPIPSWTPAPEQGNPATQIYNPYHPAPGIYAISVTSLHGVVLGDHPEYYAYFREREPLARIGNSIFIYQVEPEGEPLNVAYSRLRPADLDATLQFETNDVRVRWFDQATTFIWPENGGWMVVDQTEPDPFLAGFWAETAVRHNDTQRIYQLPAPPQLDWFTQPVSLENQVSFLGAQLLAQENNQITLLTAWRCEQPLIEPMKIFIHALDSNEQIVGQWDGLDSDVTSWQAGDVFVQLHRFEVGDETAVTQFATGIYSPETVIRLGERILFTPNTISEN